MKVLMSKLPIAVALATSSISKAADASEDMPEELEAEPGTPQILEHAGLQLLMIYFRDCGTGRDRKSVV